MFGYIKKDELLKTLREEIRLQEGLRKSYDTVASNMLEMKLKAKTESDQNWYGIEHHKYRQWSLEANYRWCEAVTIYNMVKQM